MILDGLKNLMANLGTSADKASQSTYSEQYLSPAELENAFRYAWLPRKAVVLPAEDAVRQWRQWEADDASVTRIENIEEKLGLRRKVYDALILSRLYGGAAIYIGTASQRLTAPMGQNETIRHFTVLGPNDFAVERYNDDATSEGFGEPESFRVGTVQVHPSRLAVFRGGTIPGDKNNWLGDSILMPIYEALRNADACAGNAMSLVFEAKVDVFKIPGLMRELNDAGYEASILKRLRLAQHGKSINNALLMDAEEGYEQKSVNFGSLDQLMMDAYQLAAGACGIPVTRLLGQSASGLNSSGNNEIREYYDSIKSKQELDITPAMDGLDRALLRTAGVDESINYTWRSLWQPTEHERADTMQKSANAVQALANSQLFDPDRLARASEAYFASSGLMPTLDDEPTEDPTDDLL